MVPRFFSASNEGGDAVKMTQSHHAYSSLLQSLIAPSRVGCFGWPRVNLNAESLHDIDRASAEAVAVPRATVRFQAYRAMLRAGHAYHFPLGVDTSRHICAGVWLVLCASRLRQPRRKIHRRKRKSSTAVRTHAESVSCDVRLQSRP